MLSIKTKNFKETKKVAAFLAKEIICLPKKEALVVALGGELGSGKTTFVQGFAEALGVKEKVLSPTFVLLKIYSLKIRARARLRRQEKLKLKFRHLVHIDCYRLGSSKDLLHLGFADLLKNKDAIILIEWAGRVKEILPKNTLWIKFKHGGKPNERTIAIKS